MGVNGIYGLSGSGLDVESMVKVGMMSKQSQLEKMQQTYTKNEWKKETYLEVYDKVQDYNLSTLSTFTKSANMNARTATSSNPLISVDANASAPAMNHTITVNQTATNAYLVGTKNLTRDSGNEGSTYLKDVSGLSSGSTISFTIADGTESGYQAAKYASATFTSSSAFLSTSTSKFHSILEDALDADSDNGNSGSTTALQFAISGDNAEDTSSMIDITYGDIAKLLADEDSTVQDLVDLLNKRIDEYYEDHDSAAAVTASYDASTRSLTFTNDLASETATVSVMVTSGTGEFGAFILNSLYDKADTATQALFDLTDEGADSLNFASSSGGSPAVLGTTGTDTKTVSLNIGDTTSFYDLVSAVNNKSTNIRMTYDSYQDKFSIYNMKTGSTNSINIVAGDANTAALFNAMGLKATTSSNVQTFTANKLTTVQGTDAEVVIDGDTYKNIPSNSLPVNGVTYTFGNVTEKTSAVVTVEQDKTKIIDNVKSFVESYNTLINELQDMYRESPHSSYAPLTDAQKAEMTEDQIKKWEEKAKSGMLYHDPTLRKIIDQMRNSISTTINLGDGYKYDSAYSIGISTKGLYGQIQVDEDKLRAALNDDPDSVYKVFATLKTETVTDENGISSSRVVSDDSGIAQRLGQVMTDAVKSIKNVAGTSKDTSDDSQLSTLLRNLQTKMSSFQSMMNAFEESLYKKYDAMESTLAMLGSQLNYVTGMFA